MDWTREEQAEFDRLRQAELQGSLSPQEEKRLEELVRMLEVDEAARLSSGLFHVQIEQENLRQRLHDVQYENDALARLSTQQEQLIADARAWLTQFQQRHAVILRDYTRLTGDTLVSTEY